MKQGDCYYNPENKQAEQPNLTLGIVDCIPRFPNNISSLLGTTIGNKDVYYQYYMTDSQSYTVPDCHLY